MTRKLQWYVRLGQTEWSRHTYDRPSDSGITLLGSVRRGAQIGALATTSAGQYIQIVGDHITTLHKGQLERALAHVKSYSPRQVTWKHSAPRAQVVIKRHRVFTQP